MVTYARCIPHPAIYLSPQRCPPALETTWTEISNTDLSVCYLGQHPVPSPYQLCAKAFSLSPTLSLSRDKNTGSPETCSFWLVLTSTPGAFPCPPTMATSQVRPGPGTHRECLGPALRLLLSLRSGLSVDLKLQLAQKGQ